MASAGSPETARASTRGHDARAASAEASSTSSRLIGLIPMGGRDEQLRVVGPRQLRGSGLGQAGRGRAIGADNDRAVRHMRSLHRLGGLLLDSPRPPMRAAFV